MLSVIRNNFLNNLIKIDFIQLYINEFTKLLEIFMFL